MEAIHELRIYPFARFFDFKTKGDDDDDEREDGKEVHTSWFFIALSFHIAKKTIASDGGEHNVDLTDVIQEFAFIVDQWEQRHGGMDLQINHLKREEVPAWVVQSTDGTQASGGVKKEKKRMGDDTKCFTDDDTPHAQRRNGSSGANGSKRVKGASSSSSGS